MWNADVYDQFLAQLDGKAREANLGMGLEKYIQASVLEWEDFVAYVPSRLRESDRTALVFLLKSFIRAGKSHPQEKYTLTFVTKDSQADGDRLLGGLVDQLDDEEQASLFGMSQQVKVIVPGKDSKDDPSSLVQNDKIVIPVLMHLAGIPRKPIIFGEEKDFDPRGMIVVFRPLLKMAEALEKELKALKKWVEVSA
jgi:hypothetical protein